MIHDVTSNVESRLDTSSPSSTSTSMADELDVSLEPHLKESLAPLKPILPLELAQQLTRSLSNPTIPYSTLLSISKWSKTPTGTEAIRAASLDTASYSMVSLLAGVTTSPGRKFPPYVPPTSPEIIASEGKKERQQITSLVNGLLSIGGSGAAAYYASERTGWKNEWRVLFALFVAMVVTIAETVLYMIWQSRSKSAKKKKRINASHKKIDPSIDDTLATDDDTQNLGLRKRTGLGTSEQ